MNEEKQRPVHVFGGPSNVRNVMGPFLVDNAIRQAIQHCWMVLPEKERTVKKVEQEIRRLVDRALEDFREDTAAFDYNDKEKDE